MGRFALSEAALLRASQWLLANADQANREISPQTWRKELAGDKPRALFRLTETGGHARVTLACDDLREFADAMDQAFGGAPVLTRELEASEDLTGLRVTATGEVQFAYGLDLTLDWASKAILALDPSGYQSRALSCLGLAEDKEAVAATQR